MTRVLTIALVVFLLLVPFSHLYWLRRTGNLAKSRAVRWHAWVRSIALWGLFGAMGVGMLWPQVRYEWLFYVELTAVMVFGLSFLFLLFRKRDVS